MSYRDRHAKGVTYAKAGRVRRLVEHDGLFEADVIGETDRYHVRLRVDGSVEDCQCRANRQGRKTCSHIIAVQALLGLVPTS